MPADSDSLNVTSTNVYGCVIVRLTDRFMLNRVPGMPPTLTVAADAPSSSPSPPEGGSGNATKNFSVPNTVWAELVSKCAAPNFRTSSFLNVVEDGGANYNSFGFDQKEIPLSFHVMTDDALGFAILADKTVGRREGHGLLDEIAGLFKKMFVESAHQLTPKMVDVFAKPCRELMLSASGGSKAGRGDDKIQKVRSAVDEVKNMALDNVERVITRGGKIDEIVQQTDDLQFQAQGFQRSARDLRDQLWWNSMKGKLIIGGVSAAFIFLVLFTFFYDGGDKKTA